MQTPEAELFHKRMSTRFQSGAAGESFRKQKNKDSQVLETDDGRLALSPGEKASKFGIKEWKSWLSENVGGFEDNPTAPNGNPLENAALMISSLSQGVDYMHSQHVVRGNTEFKKPFIYVVIRGEESMVSDVTYMLEEKVIAVRASLLRKGSKMYSMETKEEIRSLSEGKTVFAGTIPQGLALLGVEECDHAEYRQSSKNNSLSKLPRSTKQAEYDAQPHEFRALSEQKSYAETHGFLHEEIAILKRRIKDAKPYRK